MSISAIIPVYNGSAHLADALHSILAQTTPVDEIIVVDDGSADDSAALAAATAPGAKIIRQAQQGQAMARNTGAAAARGDYFAFLDHDDLWPPDRTTQLLAGFAEAPEAGLICGRIRIESNAEGRKNPLFMSADGTHIPFLFQSGIIRRSIWTRLGGMGTDQDFMQDFSEDVDLYLRIIEAGIPVAKIDATTVVYRQHGSNLMRAIDRHQQNLLKSLHASINRRRAALPL
jgi:glycosyltransferase involved in cell wall biosynthesis